MTNSPTEYFELGDLISISPPKPGEFRLSTAAVMSCGLCDTVIDGMGGPGDGAVCRRCGEALKRGQLRACVMWPLSSSNPQEPK